VNNMLRPESLVGGNPLCQANIRVACNLCVGGGGGVVDKIIYCT
jgi:hypothetical protein